MTVKLYRAIKAGKTVHISEVSRGLTCDCHCPECGEQLMARQGLKRAWHFAHKGYYKCDVSKAAETALHLAAKEVLDDGKLFYLPPVSISESGKDRWGFSHRVEDSSKELLAPLCNVRIEPVLPSFRPDTLVKIAGHALAIEIAVSHRIDKQKQRIFELNHLSCLEIDLRNTPRDISPEDLSSLVLESPSGKKWIYNRWENRRKPQLLAELNEIISISNMREIKQNAEPLVPIMSEPPPQIGICKFCGEKTDDWWYFDSKTLTCACKPCYRKGYSDLDL